MIKELNYENLGKATGREEYCDNPLHPNHQNKDIIGPILHLIRDPASFAIRVHEAWMRMLGERARLGTRGPTPRAFFTETIYRSPYGADLSEEEREEILNGIFTMVAEACPAVAFWHKHPDGTWDLHVLISNCTWGRVPRLRKGAYGNGGPNYYRVLHEVENRALEIINHRRALAGRPQIETMKEARSRLALAKGIIAVHLELAMFEVEVSKETIEAQLEFLGHSGVVDGRWLKITFAGSDKQHRYNLQRMLAAVANERALLAAPSRAR